MYLSCLSIFKLVVPLLSKHRFIIIRILFLLHYTLLLMYLKFSDDFRTVSSCDRSMRSGSFVFVDMNKIGRPCTCTVNSLFVGDLLVTSLKVTTLCNTKLTVNTTVIFTAMKWYLLRLKSE